MRLLSVIALTLVLFVQPAWAEKRVALVIGNSSYPFAPLANPKNDAELMSQTLKGLGFDVVTAVDATQKNMKIAVRNFGRKLSAAGKDGVGLFFYAGHGVQVGGANYLIPTDAKIESEGDVDIEAINAQSVLAMMEYSGARLSFVIMDACRNNPFKRGFRSGARGLAKMEAPTGSLIAYATAPGDVASDGRGKNSPYTTALAKMMKAPGLSVERMFREVRNDVRAETNSKQTPWESSSLVGGNFYFAGAGNPATLSAAPAVSVPKATAPVDQNALDLAFWNSIQDSTDATMFEAYLEQFPNGTFAALARAKAGKYASQKVAAITPIPAPAPQPTAVVPAVGTFMRPGKVFKDCSDCPEMVVIPAGSFRMGDLSGDGDDDEKPVHQVTISKPFAVGKYEVTQAEWRSVMGSNPSYFKGDRNPVEKVSWDDAKEFVRKLSSQTGKPYRLLSESEWEYAARAGTSTKYPWGNSAGSGNANCDGCGSRWDNEQTAPVGSFQTNAFGLHDMHGNVWEWVEDCYNDSYRGAPSDGMPRTAGNCENRGLRGGSWISLPRGMRSANRGGNPPGKRNNSYGFRIARTL